MGVCSVLGALAHFNVCCSILPNHLRALEIGGLIIFVSISCLVIVDIFVMNEETIYKELVNPEEYRVPSQNPLLTIELSLMSPGHMYEMSWVMCGY